MKKKRVKRGKTKRPAKEVVLLFVGLVVLVLVLVVLIGYSFGFFDKSEAERFIVKDECGMILGNLVHQVRDSGECRIKCINECDVRGMDFVEFGFEGKDGDCNFCECWCD